MKPLFILLVCAGLLLVSGCTTSSNHSRAAGASYDTTANLHEGRGEYIGWPNYPQYRPDHAP